MVSKAINLLSEHIKLKKKRPNPFKCLDNSEETWLKQFSFFLLQSLPPTQTLLAALTLSL